MTAASLSVLTFNIGNPAPERAKRQFAWLLGRDEDVLVLTETKASAGCRMLAEEFAAAGYAVHWPDHGPGEYGAMIISTVTAVPAAGHVSFSPPVIDRDEAIRP
jgi:exodeoxyribonuclease III